MIRLFIIRHGQTVDNLEGRIQGHCDSPLTPLGRMQAEAIADRLAREEFSAIYSSDLGRAMATAEAIASRHTMPIRATDLLREAHLGQAQGLTRAEFEARFPEEYRKWRRDSLANRPPGAETLESVIERCGEFLRRVSEEHADGEKLAVVVHGGSVRGLICAALSLPGSFYRAVHTANASLSILDVGESSTISLLNDTCHLDSVRITEEETDTAG